jgi:hypothetical protein
MLVVRYSAERPGDGWHAHGTTSKTIWLVFVRRLRPVLLLKQRWLEVSTGKTCHDRPHWDTPGHRYGLDVVVITLCCWLLVPVGLHAVDWPWDAPQPARRTVQRWAAALAPLAADWLQTARERILDYVAPRPLEELLPAGGIPPPEGARTRTSQGGVQPARQLQDVIWLHENVARALSIPLRQLLGVARWRWPKKPPMNEPS